MTKVSRAIKKALFLIGTGTVVTCAYAVATHTSAIPPLMLGCGALMGLVIFMSVQEQTA